MVHESIWVFHNMVVIALVAPTSNFTLPHATFIKAGLAVVAPATKTWSKGLVLRYRIFTTRTHWKMVGRRRVSRSDGPALVFTNSYAKDCSHHSGHRNLVT